MIKEFNRLGEIQKYYDKESNTYVFKEDGKYITLIVFNFDLNVEANIDANDILARNINVKDIDAHDINAGDINANNIIATDIIANDIYAKVIGYWAVCSAYHNIRCSSIKGRRENSKHFVLDGKLEVTKDEQATNKECSKYEDFVFSLRNKLTTPSEINNSIYKKLKLLEDIEEDIVCPLDVREQAFNNGFYDEQGNHYYCEHYVPYLKSMHTRGVITHTEKHFNLKDYKKTWWLSETKEN